jgi:hypothetical protein
MSGHLEDEERGEGGVPSSGKSLVEEIFDEMFERIREAPEFDVEIVQALHQAAKTGEIKKPQHLQDILSTTARAAS